MTLSIRFVCFRIELNLLQAYYWLSSAIAQAFAALIALTAVFYIYRRTTLDNKMDRLFQFASHFFAWEISKKERMSEDFMASTRAKFFSMQSKYVTLSVIRKIIEEGSSDIPSLNLKEKYKEFINRYNSLDSFKNFLKSSTVTAITVSAITMLAGIAALLFGWLVHDISLECTFVIMTVESILAAIALGWTVYVVIRMLKEPEEPKKDEESQSPSP